MAAAPRRVVVGHDGSPDADRAARWGADRARRYDLSLELVHAIPVWPYDLRTRPGEDARGLAGAMLGAVVDGLRADGDLQISTCIDVASAPALLLDRAEGAESVAVGARGRGGFPRLRLGSTATQLASHAACPVFVVREHTGFGVVVGVDGSRASEAAVDLAFAEAGAEDESLTAVHACLPPYAGLADVPYTEGLSVTAEDEELLAERLSGRTEQYPDVDVRRVVLPRHAVSALLETAAGARLLVVGSHGRGAVTSALLGSVSAAVLHDAPCTVAVVRPAR